MFVTHYLADYIGERRKLLNEKAIKGSVSDIGADLDGVIMTEVGKMQGTLNGKDTGCGAKVDNQYLAVDDYRDVIVFLYQAYKMRPLAIYQEELGHNYHMFGIDQIRYRENSSAYELDRSSLMKAKRCFELVIHDTDENMRVSMIRSCSHGLLKILHILHFDFEFDRYYTDFSGYLEADRI